jgi:hypothetical protein
LAASIETNVENASVQGRARQDAWEGDPQRASAVLGVLPDSPNYPTG